jgi:hypothetical protein
LGAYLPDSEAIYRRPAGGILIRRRPHQNAEFARACRDSARVAAAAWSLRAERDEFSCVRCRQGADTFVLAYETLV